jgi:hypothetical protein
LRLSTINAEGADVEACLNAPDYCRVRAGMASQYCDATNLYDLIHEPTANHNQIARIMPPFRCGQGGIAGGGQGGIAGGGGTAGNASGGQGGSAG